MPTPFTTTVTGSYPRPVQPSDTLKKPELSRQEADQLIRWAVRDPAPPEVEVKITCTGPHMLVKFSNNKRPDLYPTDRDLAFAYADILNLELRELAAAGCQFVQFDDPAWTAFPEEAEWAAQALNRAAAGPNIKIGLHVCGGNPRRKRVYFTKYDDLLKGFATAKVDQVSLEYCTLSALAHDALCHKTSGKAGGLNL